MKILIIGEYSGFAKYLSRGFHQLGHDSFVISWGDKFKKIEQDDSSYTVIENGFSIGKTYIKRTGWLRKIISAFHLNRFIKQLGHDWDVAFIVNFGFIKMSKYDIFKPYPTIEQVKRCLKDDRNVFLSACGGDFIYYSYYIERKFRKISKCELEKAQRLNTPASKDKYLALLKEIKIIIPIAAEYVKAYKYYQPEYGYKLNIAIPVPFDVSGSAVSKHDLKGKIIVMHGVNRYFEKGSDYIIPAMEKLHKNYGDLVDINIVTRVPLAVFLENMNQANIIIDNCYGDSNSMTAVEALSMGKVVLAGNEPGHTSLFGETIESPVIDIWPDSESIYKELEQLVLHPDRIKALAIESREYASKMHDCKIVAAKYIRAFES